MFNLGFPIEIGCRHFCSSPKTRLDSVTRWRAQKTQVHSASLLFMTFVARKRRRNHAVETTIENMGPTTGFAPASTGLQIRCLAIRPRRHRAGVQGIEPCGAVLEAACFPEAHSCSPRVSDGSRTHTSCSTGNACVRPTRQTPYPRERKERESNPQGREAQPASNRVPSPIGLPFRCRLTHTLQFVQKTELTRSGGSR